MAPKKKTNDFYTNDITFASALLCMGKKLLRSQPREDRPYEREFYFEEDGTLKDHLSDFLNGEMRVDPNLLQHHIRTLKQSR